MNKKAFTLIEMLIVLLILAVVLVIAIPAVRNLTYNRSQTQYEQLENVVMQAIKVYTSNHRGEIANLSADCIRIPYESLVQEGNIEEENIHCTGSMIVRKRTNSGYSYESYLTCKDSKDKVVHEPEATLPTTCPTFQAD